MDRFDVCVRGAGPVGMALALALAGQGLRVALQRAIATPAAAPDLRTYALNAGSARLLASLDVWAALPEDARTAVYDMRIEGDAPGASIGFSAFDQGLPQLAWIVDAGELEQQLAAAVRRCPGLSIVGQPVDASLLALAEGRDSASRAALGVEFDRRPYGHLGVAARLVAQRPHAGLARQWFRSPDVLALLPFDRPQPGCSYGLVWSVPQERARELLALDPPGFERALSDATDGAAGALALAGERAAWPLQLARAHPLCGPGWVLVGDAAHLVHPLAGQGLNLGLADVESLARTIAARAPHQSPGDEALLHRHVRARALPTAAMAGLTDGLLHLFASRLPLARELRNRGLTLVDALPPLKRLLVSQAVQS
jgi:2-polyprenyl-6-methoxyphenol hydroxylase-like FAD-dependent oxidoreductase